MGYDHNSVSVQCRLTKDPECRQTAESMVASFSVAVGAGKDKTNFFDIKCWGKLAEFVQQWLKKGTQVIVSGTLDQEKWNDKETGKPRTKIIITAKSINFCGSGKKETASNDGGSKDVETESTFDSLSDVF